MKTISFCVILVAMAAGFGWMRHKEVLELRRENEALRQSAAELAKYQSESGEQDEQPVIDTNEVRELRKDWLELMRMRSEIGPLRRAAEVELPQIQKEAEALAEQAEAARKRGVDLLEERAASLRSNLMNNFIGPLTQFAGRAAQAHGGRFPRSLAEMKSMLETVPERDRIWMVRFLSETNRLMRAEAEIIGREFSVSAGDFEFIPANPPPGTNGPPVAFVREIVPRRMPDGRLARWHGFTDGRVEEVVSERGQIAEGELSLN